MSKRTTRKTAKKSDKAHVVTEDGAEDMIEQSTTSSSGVAPRTPFHAGQWSTLYEDYILNRSKEELVQLMVEILMYFGEGTLEEATVFRVVSYICDGYYDNYYHSFYHASHVVLNVSHFLLNIQAQYSQFFSRLEKFSMVYGALIHDVGHFGVTNHELIVKKHPFAVLYNDQSVAEMNSIKVGLHLLEQPGMDLLENWSEDERTKLRHNIIELVLATDIADPYKKRMAYLRFSESFINRDNGPSKNALVSAPSIEGNPFPLPASLLDQHHNQYSDKIYDTVSVNCRLAFLLIVLRTADISASMQSTTTWKIWAKNYFDENLYAALTHTGPELEIESYCRSQIGYMDGHVKMLIEKVKSAHILNEQFTDLLLVSITMNINEWKTNGRKFFGEWSSSEECKDYTQRAQEKMNGASEKKGSKGKKRTRQIVEEKPHVVSSNDEEVEDGEEGRKPEAVDPSPVVSKKKQTAAAKKKKVSA